MNFYYLGLKEETIQHNNFFKRAALVVSSTTSKNLIYKELCGENIDYNKLENFKKISKFYDKCIKFILKEDKNARFMMYNQYAKKYMLNRKHLVCCNSIKLISQLNNKPIARKILKNDVNILDYKYIKGKAISINLLEKLFNNKNKKFVVQQPFGFGGVGTYILDRKSANSIIPLLHKNVTYSVSEYVENVIPINNTFIISNNHILIFNGSCQLINKTSELAYNGWNFESYKEIDFDMRNKIKNQTTIIAKHLQQLGYRGIGGVDYIVKQNNIFFMEINPRFQASSEELDKYLVKNNLPSIFELNYLSFYNEKSFKELSKKVEEITNDKFSNIKN